MINEIEVYRLIIKSELDSEGDDVVSDRSYQGFAWPLSPVRLSVVEDGRRRFVQSLTHGV